MRILRACGQIAELIFSCTRTVLPSGWLGAGSPPPRRRRIAAGREPEPTAAVIDSQSVKASETVAAASRGFDAGKKV
jgi:hypothetical protein